MNTLEKKGLTLTDRLGLFYGTVMFLVMLPVTIFVSAIPAVVITNAISNKVIALTMNLGIMAMGGLVTLLVAFVSGLALSYGLSWVGRLLHVQQFFEEIARNHQPLEACRKINLGAFAGMILAGGLFLAKGETPIHTVTSRVEHLFPEPLVLSLGSLFSFDLSHTYAATTGFLAVGFLFAIIGIAAGSLIVAAVETVSARTH